MLFFHEKKTVFYKKKNYRKIVVQHIKNYTNVHIKGNYSEGSVIGKDHSTISSCNPSYGGGEF